MLLLLLTIRICSATSILPAFKPIGRKWVHSYNSLRHFQLLLPSRITPLHLSELKSLVPRNLPLPPRQLPHYPHFPYQRTVWTSLYNRYLTLPLITLRRIPTLVGPPRRRACLPWSLRTQPRHKMPSHSAARTRYEHTRRHHTYGCPSTTNPPPASLLRPHSRQCTTPYPRPLPTHP